tara:strand:+ start:140 stop:892 length:753 start_codon:yes stop_codon:yes gene_type:complete
MLYRLISLLFLFLMLLSCDQTIKSKKQKFSIELENRYRNSGFALVYQDDLQNIKKLEARSLNIYHKSLKKKSIVKITNPVNQKYLIAEVKSNRVKFSNFFNSVLSLRIAEELELDLKEPYVEIILVSKNSTFIAKKAKMFDEERSVAEKAPVDGILINDLNNKKIKKKKNKDNIFSYSIKIADFYYYDTAQTMINRIKNETSIKNSKMIRLSETKFRVLIGPFSDIKSLKDSFEKMNSLNFDNLEILKNV